MLILEEKCKWHKEAFASELFIYIYLYIGFLINRTFKITVFIWNRNLL